MEGVPAFLLTQGVLGVACLVLGAVVIYLYKDNKTLQKEKSAIQDQRLTDAKETRDKLLGPLEKTAETSEKMYELLLSSKRGV